MMLASPDQASIIFNPDGPHPVRQKHAFVVRFLRPAAAGPKWREGLTFVVKAIDRPSVQPVIEEINQYNRKRLVSTGVKYQPINCTFYDTADGAAMEMWLEYARYYYGDYRLDPSSYSDDILNPQIDLAAYQNGAGATIQPPTTAFPEGINSQFFFDKVVVYQVWGNEYTSYELINPRINQFTPDELDYEQSAASTVQMSLQYEAINHGNRGRPQDLFTDAALEAIFSEGPFNGNMIEVSAPPRPNSFSGNTNAFAGSTINPNSGVRLTNTRAALDRVERTTAISDGGVLSRFGDFSFGTSRDYYEGTTSNAEQDPSTTGSAGDALHSAVGDEALRITGLARALSVAATENDGSALDEVDKNNGILLSDTAITAFNDQMDGTFLGGVKK